MSLISLLTDFGTDDEYVGVIKAVILTINPTAVIVDISHRIEPQGVLQAALMIRAAYRFFPKKSIHTIVVDPEVGSDREILICEKAQHMFVAPDNGVLTLLLEQPGESSIIRVQNSDYFLKPVSQTFHGRDIFAPVAANLSKGAAMTEFGPALDPRQVRRIDVPRAFLTKAGGIVGHVIAVDRFGNLITNIEVDMLAQSGIPEKQAMTTIAGAALKGIMSSYISVKPGDPLVITGSRGCLEIAVHKGSARARFDAAVGAVVQIGKDG